MKLKELLKYINEQYKTNPKIRKYLYIILLSLGIGVGAKGCNDIREYKARIEMSTSDFNITSGDLNDSINNLINIYEINNLKLSYNDASIILGFIHIDYLDKNMIDSIFGNVSADELNSIIANFSKTVVDYDIDWTNILLNSSDKKLATNYKTIVDKSATLSSLDDEKELIKLLSNDFLTSVASIEYDDQELSNGAYYITNLILGNRLVKDDVKVDLDILDFGSTNDMNKTYARIYNKIYGYKIKTR